MSNFDLFSDKAKKYDETWPDYSVAFIEYLIEKAGPNSKIIYDVGAGTGILTRPLATFFETVFAIEPNNDMLELCKKNCVLSNVNFINASSYDIPDNIASADAIFVGTAFNIFDIEKTLACFRKKMNTNGLLFLVWNTIVKNSKMFDEIEESKKKFCPNFNEKKNVLVLNSDSYDIVFREKPEYRIFPIENIMHYDSERFLNRYLSLSYSPIKVDSQYDDYVNNLRLIFNKYQEKGIVSFKYKTISYVGQI